VHPLHRPTPARAYIAAIAVALCLVQAAPLLAPSAFAQIALPGMPAAHPAAPSAPAAPPALTPQEAKQMLNLLNDPQKRAAFAATLETFTKATAAADPKKPGASSPVPLAPDSVGAQVISEGSSWLAGLSHQFASFGRVLGDLPTVWAFTLRTVQDPSLRATALDAAWRLAAVLAAAILAEWGTYRLLRHPMRSIAEHAPGTDDRTEKEAEAASYPMT